MLNERVNFKKVFYFLLLIILSLSGLFFTLYIRNISYLQISSTSLEPLTIQIYQPDGSKREIRTTNGNKIRVKNGSFTLFATSNNGSYFLTNQAPSFMRQKIVNISLAQENNAEYVGEASRSCFLKNTVLVSYICGASFANVQFQNPATQSIPQFNTFTRNKTDYLTLYENISTNNNEYVLAKYEDKPLEDYEDFKGKPTTKVGAYYGWALIAMNEKDKITASIELPDLNKSNDYRVKRSGDGLIIFSQKEIFYYDINLKKVNKISVAYQDMPIVDADMQDNKLVVVYAKRQTDPKGKKEPALLILYNNNKRVAQKTLKEGVEKIAYCGPDSICVKSNNLLIYSISGNKLRQKQVVSGVNQLFKNANSTLLITDKGVVNLNTSSGEGSVELNFEPYSYLNISESKKGYLVSLRSSKKQVVVEVIKAGGSANQMVKKIGELEKSTIIKNLSVSGKIIFFTPNIPLVWDQGKRQMVYDQDAVLKTNQQIINRAKELGIPADYQLIGTIR